MSVRSAVFGGATLLSPPPSPTLIQQLSLSPNLDESSASLNRDSDTLSLKDEPFTNDAEERIDTTNTDKNSGQNPVNESRFKINKDLLIYKAFYLIFYGAVGSLFPYLAVFYKQLYLSAQQVGFLIGIRPFIQMSAGPLWGALADTYNVKKIILLTSLFAWLATNYSVSLVRVPPETACFENISLIKIPEVGKLRDYKSSKNYVKKMKYAMFKSRFPKPYTKKILKHFYSSIHSRKKAKTKIRQRRKVSNGSTFFFLFAEIPEKIRNDSRKPQSFSLSEFKNSLNDLIKKTVSLRVRREVDVEKKDEKKSSFNNKSVKNNAYDELVDFDSDRKLPIERLLAADELEEEFDSLNTDEEYPWPLDTIESAKNGEVNEARKNSFNIFIVLIVITIVGTVLASPAATLADTATLENLNDKTYQYGYQRLWGAFGWGMCAFIVGIVVSSVQKSECEKGRHVDYILSFYVYAVMMALAIICAFFFKFKPVEKTSAYTSSLWEAVHLFTDCQHGCFVITLLTSGAAMGFIHTFLFWHLHDIGGTQFLFSIISAVQCVSEVLTYLISGYLMFKIGCDNLFYIGLLSNVFRMLAYSFIKNPLFSIPLEILQGISSASIWTAAICYVGLIPGIPVTLQALLHGVYWGLGHGGGGILGGVMVTYIGSKYTFIVLSAICFVNFLILISLKYRSKLMEILGNYTYVENIRAGTYILTTMSQRGHDDIDSNIQNERNLP